MDPPIRKQFYELLVILKDADPEASRLSLGPKIALDLEEKLKSHTWYRDTYELDLEWAQVVVKQKLEHELAVEATLKITSKVNAAVKSFFNIDVEDYESEGDEHEHEEKNKDKEENDDKDEEGESDFDDYEEDEEETEEAQQTAKKDLKKRKRCAERLDQVIEELTELRKKLKIDHNDANREEKEDKKETTHTSATKTSPVHTLAFSGAVSARQSAKPEPESTSSHLYSSMADYLRTI